MRDERKGYVWRGLGRAERSPAFSGDNQIVMEYIGRQAEQKQNEANNNQSTSWRLMGGSKWGRAKPAKISS
jgi:hypothetical protein